MSKSLAYQKFSKSIEAEIRNFWHLNTALIYAKRWWETIGAEHYPGRITQYLGDNVQPFTSIDIPPADYLANESVVVEMNRENSLVGFITTFEVYLNDIMRRMIYLDSSLVNTSEMPFEAKQIAVAMEKTHFKSWFVDKVADKYLRNLTHLKMILKLEKMATYEIKKPKSDLIEEWNKWTYVRNAVVHNGRTVSEDLHREWQDKFPRVKEKLKITNRDFNRVHHLAVEICKHIDAIIVKKFIAKNDAILLVRELFIKDGTEDTKILQKSAMDILNQRLTKADVEKAIALQRRTNSDTYGWSFSAHNFQK